MRKKFSCSTGTPALDTLLQGVEVGDNIVWEFRSADDYLPFIQPFCRYANSERISLLYFHFTDRISLLPPEAAATVVSLKPADGIDQMIEEIIRTIENKTRVEEDIFYCVFDILSFLTTDFHSDDMLLNFFLIVAPYLRHKNCVSFFGLNIDYDEGHMIKNLKKEADIVLRIYNNDNKLYLHPITVKSLKSPTLYTLHEWIPSNDEKGEFKPVYESSTVSQVLTDVKLPELSFIHRRLNTWYKIFDRAQDIIEREDAGESVPKINAQFVKNHLIRMLFADDDHFRLLAVSYIKLQDLVWIGRRMIGTGKVGGKSSGMLLAQSIVRKNLPELIDKFETHDSYFLGSHLYYTFLVKNDIWWERRCVSNPATLLDGLEQTRKKIMEGKFDIYIRRQFEEMLNYYGQSPIIVRSSSIMEDAFGNSFSGKYDSFFLPNSNVNPEERLTEFIHAVKLIYVSSLSREALLYRKKRQVLEYDEEMAILVQRVSGVNYETAFFPDVAGVGFSYNPYVWDPRIDPKAGFLRLVYGLGTRAVDRVDFTRLVALNIPSLRTSHNMDQIRRYSQQKIDYLDLKENKFATQIFRKLATEYPTMPIEYFTTKDDELEERAEQLGKKVFSSVLTFEPVIENGDFIRVMSKILDTLQDAYAHPVDVEFTGIFRDSHEDFKINIVQCRPFHIAHPPQTPLEPIEKIAPEQIIFQTHGPIMGNSRLLQIDRFIYVVPQVYGKLGQRDKYMIARLIGRLNQLPDAERKKIMIIGPGRWGTTSPSLGIPVSYEEINTAAVICEVAYMHEGLIPDLSVGSHFFNNLVEGDIAFISLNPEKNVFELDENYFHQENNLLAELIPDQAHWAHAVKVIAPNSVFFHMDISTQKGVLYIKME